MRRNQFAEILLITILLFGAIGALSFLVNNYSILSTEVDFYIGYIGNQEANAKFPVYKGAQTMSAAPKNNLNTGMPPMITRNDYGRDKVSVNNNGSNQGINNANYAVNSKKYGDTDQKATTVMGGGMPNIAFRSATRNASSNNGVRGSYSAVKTSTDSWGSSKAPFAAESEENVILIDPKADPLAENQIPIGKCERVLVFFGMIYFFIKKRKLCL